MSRPTLRDVAARAGMSITQASRALNDHDDVAESTKARARQVAAELKYTPNLEARRLKDPGARAGAFGIILPQDSLRFSDPFFGELLSSMVAEAANDGVQLSLSTHPANTPQTDPYDLAIRAKQVDGFVLLRVTNDDPRIAFLRDANMPFVTFGRPEGQRGFAAVEVVEQCFDPVVAHLRDLGHQRIACVAEPSRFAVGASRLAAFRDAVQRGGLRVDDEAIVEAGFHEGSGCEATHALLDRSDDTPTAIVAMNDLLALGVLEAASARGLQVPTDLTVVGFDDIRAARQVQPALTTVRQSPSAVGEALIRLLTSAAAAGTSSDAEHHIETSLVIRGSSGIAAD